MDQEDNQAGRNRRRDARHAVDGPASLMLVHHGADIPCRLVDLSLGGCQIYAEKPFLAGPMVRVEVVFQVIGEAFRIAGVTQWTRGRQRVGVRFLDVSERKRNALMQLIKEIEEYNMRRASALQNAAAGSDTAENA
ncbi:MAG: PilZ domain-containing protein [Terracidiphilus sp.]